MLSWVKKAWDSIDTETIIKSFAVCGQTSGELETGIIVALGPSGTVFVFKTDKIISLILFYGTIIVVDFS